MIKIEDISKYMNVSDELLSKAFDVVTNKMGQPNVTKQEFQDHGIYNTVALNKMPHRIMKIKDAYCSPEKISNITIAKNVDPMEKEKAKAKATEKQIGKPMDKYPGWPLECKIIGQQVVCSRNLVAPVSVEYVTQKDDNEWNNKFLCTMRNEIKVK